jgi:defect in organelle trafficking protein DotC
MNPNPMRTNPWVYGFAALTAFIAINGPAMAGQHADQAPAAATTESASATPTLEALINPGTVLTSSVPTLRAQMIHDAGATVGFRGGLAARAQEIRSALKQRADKLAQIFRFASLVSKKGTLPPVIVEAKDVAAVSDDQIRTAHRVYKIERAERLISVPPTWQDYVLLGLPMKAAVELPTPQARPQSSSEQAIWRAAVQGAWLEGTAQADAILAVNFSRLTRDYTGMLRYSTLLQQGMVSSTRVAETQQTLTGTAQQIVLGDTLRRVTSKAMFETDTRKWRPTIRYSPARAN